MSECECECWSTLRKALANRGGGPGGPSISSAGDDVRLNAPES